MKRLACFLAVLAVLLSAAAPADAHGRRRGRASFGAHVIIGGPIWWGPAWWPYWYPPYYAAPPVIVREEPQPQVYVQQQAPTPPAPQQYWYYCPDSKVYYPYVQECSSDWLKVVPQAPSPAPPGQSSQAPPGPPPEQ